MEECTLTIEITVPKNFNKEFVHLNFYASSTSRNKIFGDEF
jgi:hypothetical protein